MRTRFVRTFLVLSLVVGLAASPLAAGDRPAKPAGVDPLAKLLAEGWRPVTDSVLQRQRTPTKVETLALGAEGLAWVAERLEEKLAFFRGEQEKYPSQDLARFIESQEAELARLQERIELAQAAGQTASAVLKAGCDFCYGAHADAFHLTASQGVGATADANFRNDCGNSGTTSAYAFARATLNGTTTTVTQTDPDTGTNITSTASASVNGSTNCYSEASATVQSTSLGISFSVSETNSLCPAPPPPPPAPTISGTSSLFLVGFECETASWSVSVSGGSAPLSYQWKVDGVNAGTGTTLSRTYCGPNINSSFSDVISVTVTDSLSRTGSDTHTLNVSTSRVFDEPECGGPMQQICP